MVKLYGQLHVQNELTSNHTLINVPVVYLSIFDLIFRVFVSNAARFCSFCFVGGTNQVDSLFSILYYFHFARWNLAKCIFQQ